MIFWCPRVWSPQALSALLLLMVATWVPIKLSSTETNRLDLIVLERRFPDILIFQGLMIGPGPLCAAISYCLKVAAWGPTRVSLIERHFLSGQHSEEHMQHNSLSQKWSWNWKLCDILMFLGLMIAPGPLCATTSPVNRPQSRSSWLPTKLETLGPLIKLQTSICRHSA